MNLASEWGLNAAGDPGRMGFFSSLQQRKGAQKQMLPDTKCSELSPAPVSQGTRQYLAVSSGQIQAETGEHSSGTEEKLLQIPQPLLPLCYHDLHAQH